MIDQLVDSTCAQHAGREALLGYDSRAVCVWPFNFFSHIPRSRRLLSSSRYGLADEGYRLLRLRVGLGAMQFCFRMHDISIYCPFIFFPATFFFVKICKIGLPRAAGGHKILESYGLLRLSWVGLASVAWSARLAS
jgi:hypothetical protein